MGISTAIAVAGLAVSAGSAAMQYSSSKKMQAAQDEGIAAQQRAEALRQRQMELDATRRRRDLIRKSIQSRSQAVATATAQGASGGSGLQGGLAGITNATAEGIRGVNQSVEIGQGIFSANQDKFSADRSVNSAKSASAMYGGLNTLGGALISNSAKIGTIGTNVFARLSAGSAVSNFNTGSISDRAIY